MNIVVLLTGIKTVARNANQLHTLHRNQFGTSESPLQEKLIILAPAVHFLYTMVTSALGWTLPDQINHTAGADLEK